jgi:hypothetical protein
MNRKKLDKLWKEIEAARRNPQKGDDLERLAVLAGRTLYAGGNHPMWQSHFSDHRPFPIPRHGGNHEVAPRVRKTVLDHLEIDAAAWEETIGEIEVGTASDGE